MAAGDGKTTARLGHQAEAKQFYNNFVLDANDKFNDIQGKRLQDQSKLDQYNSYINQELLTRQFGIDSFDKQYGSYNQGLDYIDKAAQTAFDQEFLGLQQSLRGYDTDFDALQRQNNRGQLQSFFATKGLGYNLSNQGFQKDNLNIQKDNVNLQKANNLLQRQSINNNINSAEYDKKNLQNQITNNKIDGEELRRQSERLKIEDTNRREQYGVQMNEQSLQMQKQASESRLAMLTESLKGQANAGTSAASGKRGNSAKTAIRSATTLSSINSQAVANNLERGNASFKNAVAGLTSQNQSAEQISASKQETIDGQKKQNINNRNILKNQKKQTTLKISNLEKSRKSLKNDKKLLTNQNKTIDNKKRILKNERKGTKNSINEVAAMLGISNEQFEADAATLSQMYSDQLPAFENIIERISNSVYKDKANLYNKMPLPPRFAALAEAPLDVPIPGRVPRTLNNPNQYDSDQTAIPKPPSSGGSSGLGSLLGGIAGVGITAATGGLAAPTLAAGLGTASTAFGLGSSAGGLFEGVFNY